VVLRVLAAFTHPGRRPLPASSGEHASCIRKGVPEELRFVRRGRARRALHPPKCRGESWAGLRDCTLSPTSPHSFSRWSWGRWAALQDPNRVLLWSVEIDTREGEPPVDLALRIDAHARGERRYYIVQFTGSLVRAWKGEVRRLEGELVDYLPDNAFVVRTDEATPGRVSGAAGLRGRDHRGRDERRCRQSVPGGRGQVTLTVTDNQGAMDSDIALLTLTR